MMVITKYANRKRYGTLSDGKKGYLNLEDIIELVRQGKEFMVAEHRTGRDITSDDLTQCLSLVSIPDNIKKELIQRYLSKEDTNATTTTI